MKELGELSQHYHAELGHWLAAQTGIDALFTVGEEGRWLAEAASGAAYPVTPVDDIPHLIDCLLVDGPLENSILYLKGSRAFGLDTVPALLTQLASTPPKEGIA